MSSWLKKSSTKRLQQVATISSAPSVSSLPPLPSVPHISPILSLPIEINQSVVLTRPNHTNKRHAYRIGHFSSHPGLVHGEVSILKQEGYEIYLPRLDSQLEDDISIYRNCSMSVETLDLLDKYNPYKDEPSDEIINIFIKEFDILIITLLSLNIVPILAKKSDMPILIRIFGREGEQMYYNSYRKIEMFPNVYFGMGYREMLEIEPKQTWKKYIYLPLPPNYYYQPYCNTWKPSTGKIMFVCSYIDESPYYNKIYHRFKQLFGDLPHVIYGRHGIMNEKKSTIGETMKSDFCIIPNCSSEEYRKAFQTHEVMYYHSNEPRHIHYHPIEAIMVGMPVVFLENSLLDSMTNKKSSGRCATDIEAKEKIKKIINGDTILSQAIIRDNSVLLSNISKENYLKSFVEFRNTLQIAPNKALLVCHYGIGDAINMIPAVNYLCTKYKEVKIVCLQHTIDTVKTFYENNSKVTFLLHNKITNRFKKFHSLTSRYGDIFPYDENDYMEKTKGYDILRCGIHRLLYQLENDLQKTNYPTYCREPFCFYNDVSIPESIFWNNFTLPSLHEDNNLYTWLQQKWNQKYVFVHNLTSTNSTPVFHSNLLMKYGIDINTTLCINPTYNMYSPSHNFYQLAEGCLNKPLVHYKELIENAYSIFVTNSSFFCFCLHLTLKAIYKIVIKRDNTINYIWDERNGYPHKSPLFMELDMRNPNVKMSELPTLTYISGGKLGDFIFQLGIIDANYRKTGKKGILYIADIGDKFIKGVNQTYEDTKEFVLKQEYIQGYEIFQSQNYQINLSKWREHAFANQVNWYDLFQHQYHIPFGLSKWLEHIPVDETLQDTVIIAHSLQRENTILDIHSLINQYQKHNMLFVSLDQKEYTSFQSKYNIEIPHYHCRTIMDLIMKINSCKTFIGNFSAPFTIAIALHKTCIGIPPTNERHTIDLQLMKNMNTYWKHVTIL